MVDDRDSIVLEGMDLHLLTQLDIRDGSEHGQIRW